MKLSQLAVETTCFKKVDPDLIYDTIAKTGVKQLEFYAGAPIYCHYESLPASEDEIKAMRSHVREQLDKHGMKIAVLAPQSTDYEINIASDVDLIREKSVRYFIGYLQDLADLGCDSMMLTYGWGYFDKDAEPAWKRACQSLKEISAEASKLGVSVLLRPVWKYGTNLVNNISSVAKMFEEVGSDALKVALDVGGLDEGETITDYFKTFGKDKIGYFKFSNFTANGQVTTGDGVADVKEYFDELDKNGYTGAAGIEMNYEHTENPGKYIQQAVENLKTICE